MKPTVAIFAIAIAASAQAFAQDGGVLSALVDGTEHDFGATNVAASLGDGHLAAGIAQTGEITVLRWPGPVSPDQIRYKTLGESPDGGTARSLPYFGARADMGFFAGMKIGDSVSWFRDPPWTITQAYASEDSPVLVTTYTNGSIMVTQSDFVSWQQDVLVRRLQFSGLTGTTRVYLYGALAPCGQRTTEDPSDDWAYDDPPSTSGSVDFALFYSASDQAMIQLRPNEENVESLRPAASDSVTRALASDSAAQTEADAIDTNFGAGFYFAWGASQAPAAHMASTMQYSGRTSTETPVFESAVADALDGSNAGLAPAAGALAFDLTPSGGSATLDVFLSAGTSSASALAGLAGAKKTGAAKLRSTTESQWSTITHSISLPDSDDAQIRFVAKRAIMNIITAQDSATGAIAASITTQPPYAQDWPRDSAFIGYVLDRAGLPDRTTASALFLANLQRLSDMPEEPAGSWAMDFYADGQPGGPIEFEIDETALTIWGFVDHAEFLDSLGRHTDASNFRNAIYPALKRAADLLAACKDPSGLQCLASEDDTVTPSQTLQGASTVLLAMNSAAALAAKMGQTGDQANWSARVASMKAALLANFVDSTGLLTDDDGNRGWALWPVGVFAPGDSRIDVNADVLLADLQAALTGQTAGSSYNAKATCGLAEALGKNDPRRAQLKQWVDALLKEIPNANGSYGEVFVTLPNPDGGTTFESRTAVPHVWEGALNWLSGVQFYGARAPPKKGCGCGEGGGWELLILAFGFVRWRRR